MLAKLDDLGPDAILDLGHTLPIAEVFRIGGDSLPKVIIATKRGV